MDQENRKQFVCLGFLLLGPLSGLISLLINMFQGIDPVTACKKTLKLLVLFTMLGLLIPPFIPERKVNRRRQSKNLDG